MPDETYSEAYDRHFKIAHDMESIGLVTFSEEGAAITITDDGLDAAGLLAVMAALQNPLWLLWLTAMVGDAIDKGGFEWQGVTPPEGEVTP